ncbi:hypothetical protein Scep_017006 [Stephania cephalantha]|uniref:Uncharacterized protein n=1 Tax=Stephania cephalantha TaxID=152367 RepID=A0AAP0NTU8_9MAGN
MYTNATAGRLTRHCGSGAWIWIVCTVVDAFDMADRVIAFLSGAEDTYESTETATQSEGGTTSTMAARQYGRKGKQPRVKP